MQNILTVVPGLIHGGAERMLVTITNGLDRTRFTTTVVALSAQNPLAPAIDPCSAEILTMPRAWKCDLGPVWRLRQVLQERAIQVVLSFGLFGFLFVRLAKAGLRDQPAVLLSIHSMGFSGARQQLLNRLYLQMLEGSEQFIAVADAQADYWARTYHIPRPRFTTVHGGVDVDRFSPPADHVQRLATRQRLGIPDNARVIILTAALRPEKRHEEAVAALRILRDRGFDDVFLLFVGGDVADRMARIKCLISGSGLDDRVRLCGVHSDVHPLLAAADLFTLTSNTVETFSQAALEAMATGLPCVLTDVGGAREMIVEGVNGYLVPPSDPAAIADGWARALEQLDAFDRTAIRGRVVQQFSARRMIQQYEAMLASAASLRATTVQGETL